MGITVKAGPDGNTLEVPRNVLLPHAEAVSGMLTGDADNAVLELTEFPLQTVLDIMKALTVVKLDPDGVGTDSGKAMMMGSHLNKLETGDAGSPPTIHDPEQAEFIRLAMHLDCKELLRRLRKIATAAHAAHVKELEEVVISGEFKS